MKLKKYKLGEILDVTRGASLSGEFYATEGEYIRLTCGNFDYQNNCFKENKSKDNLYYIGDFRPEFLMKKGDIITPLTEQAIGLLGSTAIIPESGKYIQSQDVAKIICKENLLDKDFAFYLISSNIVKQQLSAAAQQTKIRHTSPDKIKDCTVWIPELAEQKRIGKLLRSLDRKIELNRAINQNLEAMAKQLYDYWFVQFDFPDENGRPYKSSGGKMVWNEKLKRKIPVEWEVVDLGDIASITTGKEDANLTDIKGIFPFFTCSQQTLKCNKSAFNGSYILLAGNGDFNVKHYTGEFNAYQRTYVILPHNNLLFASIYISIQKGIETFKKRSCGAIIKFITIGDVAGVPIIISRDTTIFEMLNKILAKIEFNERYTESVIKQRDELLPLLMNGQVSVNSDLLHD